jgi:hypothetical protein
MSNVPRKLTRPQIAEMAGNDPRIVRVIEQLIQQVNDTQTQLDLYMTPPAVDCQIRDASYLLPTTPTVIKPQTVAAQRGIEYDPTTGEFTLPQSRTYSTFTIMNVSVANQRTIYTYAEVNTGSGWVVSRFSGRALGITVQTDGQQSTVSINYFPAGTKLRFPLYSSGSNTNLTTVDLPGTAPGTVTAPAYRIMIAA